MSIVGNMAGCYSPMGKTFIIEDENGNELTGVVTDTMQVFDATPADVRINKTFASNDGIQTGENTITYRTRQGTQLILSGNDYTIPLSEYDEYNYTKFQCVITKYSSNVSERMAAEKISLNNNVYEVNSSTPLSSITKNEDNKSIELNITNNTSDIYMIYYFMYKEEEV